MRIGHGFDVHKFGEGNFITLGGVKIPYSQGLIAHSDGDVVLHALCDALLGACALGDIGKHFPDTDEEFAGADSRGLLRHVMTLVIEQGYQVGNVDITIIAQAPKMAPHIEAMRESITEDLNCALNQVNIKATTTEKLGFEGRKEGISVHAVALLIIK
jgi:2-C-methyl-D-erythritol 2,4-cyclodiphosphate synthase